MPRYRLNFDRPITLEVAKFLGVPFGWKPLDTGRFIAVYRLVPTQEGYRLMRNWQEDAYSGMEGKFVWSACGLVQTTHWEAVKGREYYLAEEIDEEAD